MQTGMCRSAARRSPRAALPPAVRRCSQRSCIAGSFRSAAARSFLRGGAETLTNPLELTGMVDAVQRLTRAVATGEHVAVYGDYDVDGITAACLLTDYLRFRGLTCELKIPRPHPRWVRPQHRRHRCAGGKGRHAHRDGGLRRYESGRNGLRRARRGHDRDRPSRMPRSASGGGGGR